MRTSSSVGCPSGCLVTSDSDITSVLVESTTRLVAVLLTARLAIFPSLCHVRALAALSSSVAARKPHLIGRISIVEPWFSRVRIAALLPEASSIVGEELDLADPLGALPRIKARRDHPAGTAVLRRQGRALPGMHQEHIVLGRPRERQVRRVGNVCPRSEVVAGAQ